MSISPSPSSSSLEAVSPSLGSTSISFHTPISIDVLPSYHPGLAEIISVASLLVTGYLVWVNIRLVKQSKIDTDHTIDTMKTVNRENQELSILAMRHDSELSIFSTVLAGMRGTLDMSKWLLQFTTLESHPRGEDGNGNPIFSHEFTVPEFENYPAHDDLELILIKLRSMKTKAKIDLLGSEDLGMEINNWVEEYGKIMDNWKENIIAIRSVIQGNQVPIRDSQRSLLSLKEVTNIKLDELWVEVRKIRSLMEMRLSEGIFDSVRSTLGAQDIGN